MCVRRKKEMEEYCTLVLCNGKWLKVVWNQHVHCFFLFVLTSRKVGKIIPS
jgi:hypothetical protein